METYCEFTSTAQSGKTYSPDLAQCPMPTKPANISLAEIIRETNDILTKAYIELEDMRRYLYGPMPIQNEKPADAPCCLEEEINMTHDNAILILELTEQIFKRISC